MYKIKLFEINQLVMIYMLTPLSDFSAKDFELLSFYIYVFGCLAISTLG